MLGLPQQNILCYNVLQHIHDVVAHTQHNQIMSWLIYAHEACRVSTQFTALTWILHAHKPLTCMASMKNLHHLVHMRRVRKLSLVWEYEREQRRTQALTSFATYLHVAINLSCNPRPSNFLTRLAKNNHSSSNLDLIACVVPYLDSISEATNENHKTMIYWETILHFELKATFYEAHTESWGCIDWKIYAWLVVYQRLPCKITWGFWR